MNNFLGNEVRVHHAKEIDFNLKYNWTEAALEEEEDEDTCRTNYLCPFTDIPEDSGVYLFCFPDGGYYIGQAVNLKARFTGHFYDFFSPKCKDWHKSLGLKSWKRTKIFLKDYCNYYYMKVDKDKLNLYERSALAQIVKNNKTEMYFNTQFYKEEEDT